MSTLPAWESAILQGITFQLSPEDIEHFLQSHRSHDAAPVQLVSDGSQKGPAMSFGWIFGTSDGTILAEHAGPAFGTPTSHRAEGWGMLSGARFLLHLCRYRRIPLPQHLHIESVSDNAGLITRMQNRRTYVTVFANATLEPDWDITEQIHASFEDIQPVTHKYAWERGHQDDTTPYHQLCQTAKYNVRADALANEFMQQDSKGHPLSPLLPAAKCQFIIEDYTVEGNYTNIIRRLATESDYFHFLQQKHGWTCSVTADVDCPPLDLQPISTQPPTIISSKWYIIYFQLASTNPASRNTSTLYATTATRLNPSTIFYDATIPSQRNFEPP